MQCLGSTESRGWWEPGTGDALKFTWELQAEVLNYKEAGSKCSDARRLGFRGRRRTSCTLRTSESQATTQMGVFNQTLDGW